LRDHLTSFEALELLLLLRADAAPAHAEALGRRAGIALDLVLPALAALESSQLIRRSALVPPTFRFAPATGDLARAVEDLERLYRDQRAAVMGEMSVNAISRIRSGTLRAFSDAFLIGKKKGDAER
jgi:hypothetical protein